MDTFLNDMCKHQSHLKATARLTFCEVLLTLQAAFIQYDMYRGVVQGPRTPRSQRINYLLAVGFAFTERTWIGLNPLLSQVTLWRLLQSRKQSCDIFHQRRLSHHLG
jgi:hypothetical protein